MLDQIQVTLQKLSDAKIQEADQSVINRGFNRDSGPISLDLAFEKFKLNRKVISHLIANGAFEHFPTQVVQELNSMLSNAAQMLWQMAAGSDTTSSLVTSLEQLHFFVWKYRLDDLPSELIDYREREEATERSLAEAQKLKRELTAALKRTAELDALIDRCKKSTESLSQSEQKALSQYEKSYEHAQQAQSSQTTAANSQSQLQNLLAQAQASRNQVKAYEEELKKLFSEGQTFRTNITEATHKAKTTVEENIKNTEQLVAHLTNLQAQIVEALQNATGVSLFHAYQERRNQIEKAKWRWAKILGGVVAIAAAAAVWIASSAFPPNSAFYLKLSVAPLLGYAIWFCTAQYNHERQLEEEYAFKSNISLSLVPYKELVDDVLDEDQVSKDKYCDFIISSVGKVFESPFNKNGSSPSSMPKLPTTEQWKQIAEIANIFLQGRK